MIAQWVYNASMCIHVGINSFETQNKTETGKCYNKNTKDEELWKHSEICTSQKKINLIPNLQYWTLSG